MIIVMTLIYCKGAGNKSPCDFTHEGKWGDDELIQHQLYEETRLGKDWRGFEIDRNYEKFKDMRKVRIQEPIQPDTEL